MSLVHNDVGMVVKPDVDDEMMVDGHFDADASLLFRADVLCCWYLTLTIEV